MNIANTKSTRTTWDTTSLRLASEQWKQYTHKNDIKRSERSTWWGFAHRWLDNREAIIEQLVNGNYQFSPMQRWHIDEETSDNFDFPDRLAISILRAIIKPTFSHIISVDCHHLSGPSTGVREALDTTITALMSGEYKYFIRGDIASYYASIPHEQLLDMLREQFDDPRLHRYFEQIITAPIDINANLHTPTKGIPIRSSLSTFFAAVYLSPLDQAFQKRNGVTYLRFNDDWLILTKTERQYRKAKKMMYNILKQLKLTTRSSKTIMGSLKTFHLLGVEFQWTQTTGGKSKPELVINIHKRSCARARKKMDALRPVVNPANLQSYLLRWATWWSRAIQHLSTSVILRVWVAEAERVQFDAGLTWIGKCLLSAP